MMTEIGANLFDLAWVKAALHFFNLFGWGLFIAGLVVAIFDTAIEYQTMIDVARRTYGNNAIAGVDQFLGYTEEKDVEVEKPKQIKNQTKLKSLLEADDGDYAMEA
jgi:hypothetical protein